uniref:Endonuclease/exonuclease/phosphatase domain-containing protein n=1 Tax=Tabanus bromius TaxID=304241 RepID=A0A0K8TMU8_TABBR
MILSGDFNTNFAEDDKNQLLIEFLNNEFGLTMSNDRNLSTTKYKTTIDAVFIRHLNRFESKLFVSYFSYHKPIVSVLEIGDDDAGNDDGERVVEIMYES